MTYAEKLKDPRWQKKRLKILKRDKFTCRDCKSTTKTLHVHHKIYSKISIDPWEYEDFLLITLCEDCHKNVFDKEAFRDILRIAVYRAMPNLTEMEILHGIADKNRIENEGFYVHKGDKSGRLNWNRFKKLVEKYL